MDRFNRFREFLDEAIEKNGMPGIDVLVWQNHKEIFRHQAGFMDMENKIKPQAGALYNIYSASKMIACVAVLQLVERGYMLLTDPLHKYLPEYENMQVKYGTWAFSPAKNKITIFNLLTMTAGLSYDGFSPSLNTLREETGNDYTTRQFAEAFAKEPLLFEPGEGWNYGFCHEVLGAVIEVASGMSFGEYLEQNIFAPLGIKESGFYVPEDRQHRIAPQYNYDVVTGAITLISNNCLGHNANAGLRYQSGGGGLVMPSEDYIIFLDAMACGGVGANGARILSVPMIELMAKNHISGKAMIDYKNNGTADGYGYGLGSGVVYDAAKCLSLRPEGTFAWGGLGGVQNIADPVNKVSFYLAQHLIASPKQVYLPQALNILWSSL
jgi:CubicO group peptidase (beta-lactamase class C family)